MSTSRDLTRDLSEKVIAACPNLRFDLRLLFSRDAEHMIKALGPALKKLKLVMMPPELDGEDLGTAFRT